MNSYSEAIGLVFGEEIDYAQIVKTFGPEESKYSTPERKYSPSRIASSEKIWQIGRPEPSKGFNELHRAPKRLDSPPRQTVESIDAGILKEVQELSGGCGF